MPTSSTTGVPYPASADADDVPAVNQELAEYLNYRILNRATNAADRDARYADAEDGAIVASTTDGTIWVRSSGAWGTLWAPTVWTPCALLSTLTGRPKALLEFVGGKRRVTLTGMLQKTDGTPISATSMAGGSTLVTVPGSLLPSADLYGPLAYVPLMQSLVGGAFAPFCRGEINTSTGAMIVWGNQDPDTSQYQPAQWISLNNATYWMDA